MSRKRIPIKAVARGRDVTAYLRSFRREIWQLGAGAAIAAPSKWREPCTARREPGESAGSESEPGAQIFRVSAADGQRCAAAEGERKIAIASRCNRFHARQLDDDGAMDACEAGRI